MNDTGKENFTMANTVIGVFVDDRIDRTIYEKAFERLDHKVEGHVFHSPEQGILAMQQTKFDVVFIEVHFWGENFGGISILHQVLKETANARVIPIAVTSYLQEGDVQKIIEAGFVICIEKPITMESLQVFCGQAAEN